MEQQQQQQQQQQQGGGGRGFVADQNGGGTKDEDLELPPGFRFHPTDEELVTHYLTKKVLDGGFVCRAIGDVDLNKCEPWDLPWRAKMGENEWYFFCVRDRKYPTGLRTNRATEAGYWKATGKDKEIHRGKFLVGMKKTLVFYKGRAPKGEKTNWVMHEYRMEGKSLSTLHNLHKTAKNEWVICRVFKKSTCVKKVFGDDVGLPQLPPLLDSTYAGVPAAATASEVPHVSCFSNVMEGYVSNQHVSAHNNDHTSALDIISKFAFSGSHFPGISLGPGCKVERQMLSLSQETGLTSDVNTEISSVFTNSHEMGRQRFGPGGLPSTTAEDCCLWNY